MPNFNGAPGVKPGVNGVNNGVKPLTPLILFIFLSL